MSFPNGQGIARLRNAASRGAAGAISAQVTQAAGSLALQALIALSLGLSVLGRFAVLFGVIVLLTALVSGFVGDSLTVLDRDDPPVRAALQGYAGILVLVLGAGAAAGATLAGITNRGEGLLFGCAAAAFVAEDLVRRLLMAETRFWRITGMDAAAAATALLTLAVGAASLSLATALLALGIGQVVGLLVGIASLPSRQRVLVRLVPGGVRAVAVFGVWRAAQQALRPALLTVVRLATLVALGYAVTGRLEAARIYVAPTMLLVGGVASFLFADYAKRRSEPIPVLLRRADRSVLLLLAASAAAGLLAFALLPWAGPLLVGEPINGVAVGGWLLFSATVAMVTPYGALAAVRGGQASVFLVRLGDSVLAAAAVVVLVQSGGDAMVAPALLAVASLLGGLALRFLVLPPLASAPFPINHSVHIKGDLSRVSPN